MLRYRTGVDLVAELEAVTRALGEAGVRYAVCGGVAVTAHGAPRSTEDLDVLVDQSHVARAIEAVRAVGYTFAALPLVFDAGTPRERQVQRITKVDEGQHLVLDLLGATGPFATMLDSTVVVTLKNGPMTFVDRATLLAMKRIAGRPKDLADIEALEGAS